MKPITDEDIELIEKIHNIELPEFQKVLIKELSKYDIPISVCMPAHFGYSTAMNCVIKIRELQRSEEKWKR